MSEIIEHEDSGNNGTLRVGEANSHVSVKVYQDMYHQITGRTEQIRKRYSDNVLLEFHDIEQLHMKLMQLCDVHNVIAKNESVSVFHTKERKEQFTSFERFRVYNSNATSPSVNVVLKYNFSITPAGIPKPQEYVVTIRLSSRVAMLQQAELDAPPLILARMVGFLSENTAEITVEYTDYVVARGYIEAFDEWIRGCKCTPKSKALKTVRRYSHYIPLAMRLCIAVVISYFALKAAPALITNESAPIAWVQFLIFYATSAYVLISIGVTVGAKIESTVDNFPVLSYLKLNKGDERLVSDFQRRRNGAIAKLCWNTLAAVAIGILSAKLEKFL